MLHSLDNISSSTHSELNTTLTREKNDKQEKRLACDFVKSLVALTFDISLGSLNARTRQGAEVAFARQVAMYIVHVRFGINLVEVGEFFNRDRTTVSHACRVIEDRRDESSIDFLLECLERSASEWQKICQGKPSSFHKLENEL